MTKFPWILIWRVARHKELGGPLSFALIENICMNYAPSEARHEITATSIDLSRTSEPLTRCISVTLYELVLLIVYHASQVCYAKVLKGGHGRRRRLEPETREA